MPKSIPFLSSVLLGLLFCQSLPAENEKPLRVLLITGGCCHDYANQKNILKAGLEARANVLVDQVYAEIPKGASATKPPLPIYGNPDYAKGYDVVIHDECAADINDPAVIKGVLAPHWKGLPGVNLHCAVHSYRIGNPAERAEADSERALWFDYLGIQSSGHGPQQPITVEYLDTNHPTTQSFTNWTTINEELYNNVKVFPTATPLARGRQTVKNKDGTTKENESIVIWLNDYHGTRVFNTTLGHNNATVDDPRYLDLVTRGVLWACGKLDDDSKPKAGYGPKK
ncbi:MAG: ThuA domain-containing protein [Verrucomicrobiota bacterium]